MFSFLCALTTKANSDNLCNQWTCCYLVFDVFFFSFIHRILRDLFFEYPKGCVTVSQFDTIALKPQFKIACVSVKTQQDQLQWQYGLGINYLSVDKTWIIHYQYDIG